jgi:tetratricopeptide (TPR) repeat protein
MKPTAAFKKALKEIYDSIPHFLADYLAEEKKGQPSLIPPNEEKMEADLKENMLSFQKRCHKGFKLIMDELKRTQDPTFNFPEFEKKFSISFHSLLAPQPFTRAILKVVSGTSWKEALAIPTEELEWLYKGAKNLFDSGRYTESCDAFSFLSWFDSSQHDFWMALGHSCFHTAAYNRAINAYGVASSILPTEPWPHIHAAACYEALGDFDQARNCLMESRILEECKEAPDKKLIQSIEIKMKEYGRGISTPIA